VARSPPGVNSDGHAWKPRSGMIRLRSASGQKSRSALVAAMSVPAPESGNGRSRWEWSRRADYPVSVTNIGLRPFEQVIERSIGGIENQMVSIPRLIMSVRYFVPGWQAEAIDVRRTTFYSLSVQSHIAANHFDFSDACRSLQSGLSPAVAACQHWIYAVRDDHAAKPEIFSRALATA
jgi:hypothetical protein